MVNALRAFIHKYSMPMVAAAFLLGAGVNTAFAADPVVQGRVSLLQQVMQGKALPIPSFALTGAQTNDAVDYTAYGDFAGQGTADYRYLIHNQQVLMAATLPGIYPNNSAVQQDPAFKRYEEAGQLTGSHWDFLNNKDDQLAFYKWTQAGEEPGVKLFFTATILEKSGHILEAIKAYHAVLVYFPKSVCWSKDRSFVWSVAAAALASAQRLCRTYPQLGIDLEGAYFDIQNGNDVDVSNDIVTVNPGHFIKKSLSERMQLLPSLEHLMITERRGKGKVQVVKFANGHWQLQVEGRPFLVRGVSYFPTEIGLGPHTDNLFAERWMFSDKNDNKRIDAPYDAWVDHNRNGQQDADEPAVGDFQLMKDMGINAIRFFPHGVDGYHDSAWINKPLLRDMFEQYGIRAIVGDFLGAYTVGSGASWEKGTDYNDPEQRRRMKENVRARVLDLKDEPFVLMWLLGNENNMPGDYMGVNATRTNAQAYPEVYARFLNEVALMIHELDPNHPVVVGNVELGLLDYYQKFAPALDILGINAYRGKDGFGDLWSKARQYFDRPVLITEYGSDAYRSGVGIDEESQMLYHEGALRDIVLNQAGGPAEGNAIGGIAFEYLDEWWHDPSPHNELTHEITAKSAAIVSEEISHEEWLGLLGQVDREQSPFARQARKVVTFYQNFREK